MVRTIIFKPNYGDPVLDKILDKNVAMMKTVFQDPIVIPSNATASQYADALTNISNAAAAGEQIIVYYTGHGLPGRYCLRNENIPYATISRILSRSHV